MISRFESFSPEVFYEIFDCLSPYDIFHAFIDLNHRLNNIIGSYSLQLDFRNISRSKFDFICHHLRPEQVISLIFSDESMADQVIVFHRYFPHFKYQFIHLRHIKYLKTEDILSDLPYSVSALTFQDCIYVTNKLIINTIVRQAKSLTYLKVDCIDILQLINTALPFLTHLYIGHNVVRDSIYFLPNHELPFMDIHLLIQNLRSPITHFNLLVKNQKLRPNYSILNFDYLSHCLTNFTLICLINKNNFSFELIQHYLIKLSNLKYLTIVLICQLDVIDGKKWEEFLRKTQIIKFNFKFILSENVVFNQNESILLDSFRSSFWLEEKQWFVSCSRITHWRQNTQISVYSIPQFLFNYINYAEDHYPPLSTVPSDNEQQIFYSRHISYLFLDFDKSIIPSIYRFTHVNSLRLAGPMLPSVNILLSIVDLDEIQELDISGINNISIGGIYLFLEHLPHLNHLIFKNFIPLFIPPSHIYSFTIKNWKSEDDLDLFCRMFSHVKSLKIDIESIEMMIELVNRLKYLEHVVFWYKFEKYAAYISMKWLRRNIWRLRRKNFTSQEGEFHLLLSIGNKRKTNNRQSDFDQM